MLDTTAKEDAYADALQQFRALELADLPDCDLTMLEICQAAEEVTGRTVEEIRGKCKRRDLVIIRRECIRQIRNQGYTWDSITQFLHRRHRKPVMEAYRKAVERLEKAKSCPGSTESC